jgi:hypothetical protein
VRQADGRRIRLNSYRGMSAVCLDRQTPCIRRNGLPSFQPFRCQARGQAMRNSPLGRHFHARQGGTALHLHNGISWLLCQTVGSMVLLTFSPRPKDEKYFPYAIKSTPLVPPSHFFIVNHIRSSHSFYNHTHTLFNSTYNVCSRSELGRCAPKARPHQRRRRQPLEDPHQRRPRPSQRACQPQIA